MSTPKFVPTSKKLVPMTEEELNAVTIVFHQYETGLREGTIYTRVLLKTSILVGQHL